MNRMEVGRGLLLQKGMVVVDLYMEVDMKDWL